MTQTVLVLGATGMLARPVVRQLLADGFAVRAGVRDEAKARKLLPADCSFVYADVHNADSIERAIDGCDVVYINLAPSHAPKAFDPELEGVKLVAAHAAKAGVKRVMRLSTMGLPDGASSWWVAERKHRSDEALRECGVDHTLFHPTWFMESLPLFLLGRRILLPEAPPAMLYWIAAEDYARQVSRAIRSRDAVNRTFIVQGKYPASMKFAVIRFIASFDPTYRLLTVPRMLLAALSAASHSAQYLQDLMEFTYLYATGFEAQETFDVLGEPTMTIEDYARSIRLSGDVPKK